MWYIEGKDRGEVHREFVWGNLQERAHSEHLGTDVRQYYNYLQEIGLVVGGGWGDKDWIEWMKLETVGRLL